MLETDLAQIYRGYIDCLNRQDWPALGTFVADGVRYNGNTIGLTGYRTMLERDYEMIPDLRFTIDLLVADKTHIASRLTFDCHPKGDFLGVAVNGRRVRFSENVFYEISEGKIVEVWSVIDKGAVEF